MLKKIYNLICCKIEESNRKWQKEQEAIKKNNCIQKSNELKAALKPHLENILRDNTYFQGDHHINISNCAFDNKNNLWRVSLDWMGGHRTDLERPHTLVSLNQTKEVYFAQMNQKLQDDLLELEMMANSNSGNTKSIEIAYAQIRCKYALLNHQLMFKSIECTNVGNTMIVKIWVAFK